MVKEYIRGSGFEDRVEFYGSLPTASVAHHLKQSHLLILPSFYEGFGIVYLEAMGFGLPAIASTAGGASEIIRHGINGYLVKPGDAMQLGELIGELHMDRERLTQMSLAAKETFEGHPTWADGARISRDFLMQFTPEFVRL
jgi:glycosyltransferase involved in cell wall biosynthesis